MSPYGFEASSFMDLSESMQLFDPFKMAARTKVVEPQTPPA